MMLYLIATFLLPAIALLSIADWIRYKWRRRKYLIGIPALPFVPLVGNIFELVDVKDVFKTGYEFIARYGNLFLIRILSIEMLVVTDTKWVETILTSPKLIGKAKEYDLLKEWLGDGLLLSTGAKWRKGRKFLSPAFHFNNLSQFVHSFNVAGDVLVAKLKSRAGQPTETFPYVSLCMLDIICDSIMGVNFNAQSLSKCAYVSNVDFMKETLYRRLVSGWKLIDLIYPLSPDYWRERRALRELRDTTDAVIRERRAYLLENREAIAREEEEDGGGGGKCVTFLDQLLNGTIDGRPLTDQEIREQVDTFMFAGHDTTTSAVCFTLWHLARHEDVQERAAAEIRAVVGTRGGCHVTYRHLNELPYLTTVIKESLRITPAVPIIGRKVEEDTTINGVLLPKGLRILMPIMRIQQPDDVGGFRPERFADDAFNGEKIFSYIPFSAGHRSCIGRRFAMLELKTILAKLIANFRVYPVKEYEESELPDIQPDIVLKPRDNLPLRFELRQ